MHAARRLLRREIEKTLFLSKHTEQIGNYLRGTEGARLVSYTGNPPSYLQTRCQVKHVKQTGSSKDFMSDPDALSAFVGETPNVSNYWLYEPYEWLENLQFLDNNIFANSFFLFRRYSNKTNQLRYFLSFGDDFLRHQISSQLSDFSDRLEAGLEVRAEHHVLYELPYSEGGRGIREASSNRQISALNPVRIALRCEYEMGISQAGTVFSDAVICGQPARVWNGANGHRFSSSCTYYDEAALDIPGIGSITTLTRSVGGVLRKLGFRGAFGCDYLFDPKSGKIFLGEANLRYTGDIALFCSGDTELATLNNLLHPHSLHILSFLGTAESFGLMEWSAGFLSFNAQGGDDNRAFFDAGAPLRGRDGHWRFSENSHQNRQPPAEYLSRPVHLEFSTESEA